MRKRAIPIIITLAILAPGLIAGAWVGSYYSTHQRHSAPHTTLLRTGNGPAAARSVELAGTARQAG